MIRIRDMNQYIQHTEPGSVKATNAADWALSHGITKLTTEEMAHLIGVPANQVSQRMAPLRRRAEIFSPARGLWIPIPAEYRTWGAPDPFTYIDETMAFLEVNYCIGWLSSAAFHGASHHAAQTFQVATSRHIQDRSFGRSRLQFLSRSYVNGVTASKETSTWSSARVASAGTTMLMVVSDMDICGGLDNVANIVIELAEENPGFASGLAKDMHLFPDAAARRVGWMLDAFGDGAPTEVEQYCASLRSSLSFLSPNSERSGRLESKWDLIINQKVNSDI